MDHVLANVDADPLLEVIGNVATGDVEAHNGDGSAVTTYDASPAGGEHVDKARVLNLFENPIVADLDSTLPGPEVVKGGLTLNQLVNLGVAVGQNLPYNHVMQAWNGQTGASLPAFPQAVEDYQLLSSPAVADVSAAAGKEVIVGTGLYYLRNINSTGAEGAGWPKFTGGWLFGVPAVGDVDGDGNLEVAALTREGNSFLWDTDRPACGDQRRVVDLPPRRVVHRRVRRGQPPTGHAHPARRDAATAGRPRSRSRRPATTGCAARRAVTGSSSPPGPINHPTDGTVVGDFDASAASGQTETHTVADIGSKTTRVAVLYQDDAGNWGRLASAAVPAPTVGFLFGRGEPGRLVQRHERQRQARLALLPVVPGHGSVLDRPRGRQRRRHRIAEAARAHLRRPGRPARRAAHQQLRVHRQRGPAARDGSGLYLPYTVDLRPGWYWLGIQTSVEHNVARYSWESAAGSRRYNLDAFADGPASPFGPPDHRRPVDRDPRAGVLTVSASFRPAAAVKSRTLRHKPVAFAQFGAGESVQTGNASGVIGIPHGKRSWS